jgi:hypothetical protein
MAEDTLRVYRDVLAEAGAPVGGARHRVRASAELLDAGVATSGSPSAADS